MLEKVKRPSAIISQKAAAASQALYDGFPGVSKHSVTST